MVRCLYSEQYLLYLCSRSSKIACCRTTLSKRNENDQLEFYKDVKEDLQELDDTRLFSLGITSEELYSYKN